MKTKLTCIIAIICICISLAYTYVTAYDMLMPSSSIKYGIVFTNLFVCVFACICNYISLIMHVNDKPMILAIVSNLLSYFVALLVLVNAYFVAILVLEVNIICLIACSYALSKIINNNN